MIRPAEPRDVAAMVALVRELAEFERADPGEVPVDEAGLAEALFGARPLAHAHVAELDGQVVAFAVWFVNFSTWLGRHGIYLEDLYVRPAARRRGVAAALVRTLAAVAVERGYGRMEWSVLDWNTGAQAFYRHLGAHPLDEWTTWRLTGESLARTAVAE